MGEEKCGGDINVEDTMVFRVTRGQIIEYDGGVLMMMSTTF